MSFLHAYIVTVIVFCVSDTKDVDIFLKFQDCGLIHDVKFVQSKPNSLKKAYIEFKVTLSYTF